MTVEDRDVWLQRIPKVELHLHLEGAIPPPTLWSLFQKYGGDPRIPSFDAFVDRFRYRDFPHFIETWVWKNGFLREYEDFTLVAEAVARNLALQNILYSEVYFSPRDFARHGLETETLAAAIRAGLSKVPEVEVALVADLVRDFGPETAITTLAEVAHLRELDVIGVGLGGSEQEFPAILFEPVFEQARALGLRTTVHAGEAAGAESVWAALRQLRADRIGHATRAEEDPRLIDQLAEERVPLEMCPISNVMTGVVDSILKHPIRRYFDRGLMVTVNTDDPAMFDTSLAHEYGCLMQALDFSQEEILQLVVNAIEASWLSSDRKQELLSHFQRDPTWKT